MLSRQHLPGILYTDISDHLHVSALIYVVVLQQKKNFMENEWLIQIL